MTQATPAPQAQATRVRLPPAPVTTTLIWINVAVYFYEVYFGTPPGHRSLGGYFNTFVNGPQVTMQGLVDLGALYGPAVTGGQWWRIFTGAFMHGFFMHIALNMLALLQLGRALEYSMGRWRMFAVYMLSLVGAGYAVVYFSPDQVTTGASGAIFGLFGALIAINLRVGERGRAVIGQLVPVLVLNLVFTFSVPEISKAGHVGGLISGFIAGFLLYVMQPRPPQPVVTDTATGETAQAELLEPEAPRA